MLASIALTDAHAHQSLNLTKTPALSHFRSNIGIACPSPTTGSFPHVDPCDCCNQATPTRWFIRPTEHQSKLFVGPMPLTHNLTTTLLEKCFTTYVKKSPSRLNPSRGDLVENFTLPYIQKLFFAQGAYTCWTCASPILCERLLCKKNTLMPPPTTHNLDLLKDRALFLRHTLLTSSHPMRGKIEHLLETRTVLHLASIIREDPPCGSHHCKPMRLENAWWIPYISTPPSENPEFQIPGHIPGQWVIWMYSVKSQSHADKTKPPKEELTKKHPIDYTESRFRAFLKSDIEKAIKNQTHENITIDPLIIPNIFTPTNITLAYSLTRDAIMKLRSAKAWVCDDESQSPNVTLRTEYVRVLFSERSTVLKIMAPLHPDRNPDLKGKPPSDQPEHYKKAYNFLNQVAKKAFDTNENGAYLIDINTTFEPDHSGDVRPPYTQDINKKRFQTKPLIPPTYEWPDPNSQKTKHTINKHHNAMKQSPAPEPNIPPNPAAEPNIPMKRTGGPHPWEYCNRCWKFGKHYSDSCPEPLPLQHPPDFKNQLENIQQTHQTARLRLKRQKKATSGGGTKD